MCVSVICSPALVQVKACYLYLHFKDPCVTDLHTFTCNIYWCFIQNILHLCECSTLSHHSEESSDHWITVNWDYTGFIMASFTLPTYSLVPVYLEALIKLNLMLLRSSNTKGIALCDREILLHYVAVKCNGWMVHFSKHSGFVHATIACRNEKNSE